jgi:monoamine oxidase
VVKERRATFEATPVFERARRALRRRETSVPLAGDYTDTDWPATMEGATISGFEAAGRLGGRAV